MRKLRQKEIELDGQAGWCAVPFLELSDKCEQLTARGMIVTAIDVELPKPLHQGCYRIYYVPKANTYSYEDRNKNIPEKVSDPDDLILHSCNPDHDSVSRKPGRRAKPKGVQLDLI